MNSPLRSSIALRRYRLAQAATVAGSLALGAMVVDHLVAVFREDFFLFYGVSDTEYRLLQSSTDSQLPLTLGQLMVAGILFFAVFGFVAAERRRLRQTDQFDDVRRRSSTAVVEERLSLASLFDLFVTRTSTFAGVLLTVWLLQSALGRWLGGLGWGIEYANWRSLLPLASVFGVCVLAGMLVAAISLVGLRAISVLELALRQIARLRWRRATERKPRRVVLHAPRTFRELLGCDILSRPPPLAC